MSLADIFNVPVDYLLGRSAISFKLDKLNKSFFGKFTIIFFEKISDKQEKQQSSQMS